MTALTETWIMAHKWRLLLFGISALLAISPISQIYDQQDNLITPFTSLILLTVIFGTVRRRWTFRLLSLLTVAWVVIGVLTDGSGLFAGESLLAPILFLVLLVAIFGLLARWMVQAVQINTEVICAAICGYLLLGLFWMGLYALARTVNDLHPGNPPVFVSSTTPDMSFGDLLYFSYTTLTTTGFGDIVPRAPVVRMLAVMEAMVGLFYNTIVIARFVGLYGAKATVRDTPGPG